jgi:predicted AlkP superfamily phosphohydrolase/phosphomutase
MKKNRKNPKVFIFGIDGGSPDLIFDKWRDELPTFNKLMVNGVHAITKSSIPPISIAAWGSMLSGHDPSKQGIFGYTYKDKRTGESRVIKSTDVLVPRVWDILAKQKKHSIVTYVPLTFPAKKISGVMVTDFLTTGIDSNCAYPSTLKKEIKKLGDTELFFDVAKGLAGHKDMSPKELINKTYAMTQMQITLLKRLLKREKWDFAISVMLGSDRLQHMLWKHFDNTHRKYIKNSPYRNELKKYYQYLDKELGSIIKTLPSETTIVVASDHGMVKQNGKININNWLIKKGYLTIKKEYESQIKADKKIWFKKEMVDMSKTLVYASGAYQARIFINKKLAGRKYKKIREKLIKELKAIRDDRGKKIDTKVFKSEEIYQNPKHPECPDLTVYFDNLSWASNPDFGQKGLYAWESAAGADSAGHSSTGTLIAAGPTITKRGYIGLVDIRQITSSILKLAGAKIPKSIKAKPLI